MNQSSACCTPDEPLEPFVHELRDRVVPAGRDAISSLSIPIISARLQIRYNQLIGVQRSERILMTLEQVIRILAIGDIVASQKYHNTIPISREQCSVKP